MWGVPVAVVDAQVGDAGVLVIGDTCPFWVTEKP